MRNFSLKMTENDNLRNVIKLEIQSLLCTEKAAISSKRLYGLYNSEIGNPIPYAQLGYKCLDDLLKSMPDVVSSYTNAMDGLLYVKAVPLESSSHINELVRGQRTSKPKKRKGSGYSLSSKIRGFRVSSQVAPNRNFNKNYNSLKPHERYDSSKTGNLIRPPSYAVPDNYSNLAAQITQLNQQPSFLGTQTSNCQFEKPNFSNNNHRGFVQSVPLVGCKNNDNMNNNINQIPLKQQNFVESKPVPLSLILNPISVKKLGGVHNRTHMTPQVMQPQTPVPQTPQLMQPRTPVAQTPQLMQPRTPVPQTPQVMQPRTPIHQTLQVMQPRTPVIPTAQVMQPRKPVPQTEPNITESHTVSTVQTEVILPNFPVRPSTIAPVEKSLSNLNISSKSDQPNSLRQNLALQKQPQSSPNQSKQFPPPIKNRNTYSDSFLEKQVEPKSAQESVKSLPQPPVAVQRSVLQRTCILIERDPKRVQVNIQPVTQQLNSPGANQPSAFHSAYNPAEKEPLQLPKPMEVQQMKPATPTPCSKLPDMAQQAPSTGQKIIPAARAPRVLLKNAIPIASPSLSSRQCRLDNTLDSIPAASSSTPTSPLSPTRLLSQRMPYRSSELQSIQRTVVNVPPRPSVRPAATSDRLAEFYCERLKTLVTTYNLGKVTLNHNQLKTGRFIASIKVGQNMFITYPQDFENVTDAYEEAARQAVIHFETTPVWMQPVPIE
ncbi:mucin-2-like isoform X2 [Daphnia carinata]|uniref:mucin-2-like isoform X2 n=1 Tax=Daphnia carinata TaxID=120202 RepID=UPI002868BAD5|nr:mucin-2-like isoform X2 [Daphnia carinata]